MESRDSDTHIISDSNVNDRAQCRGKEESQLYTQLEPDFSILLFCKKCLISKVNRLKDYYGDST